MADWKVQVEFATGNTAIINMKPRISGFRFGVLKNQMVWRSAAVDGDFRLWYKDGMTVAEMAYSEIMEMIVGTGGC